MDKRTALALLLTAVVIIGGQMLMPRRPLPVNPADSVSAVPAVPAASRTDSASPPARGTAPGGALVAPTAPALSAPLAGQSPAVRAESLHVVQGRASFTYLLPDAAPARVTLSDYRDLSPRRGSNVMIGQPSGPILRYRLVSATGDTVPVASLPVTGSAVGGVVRFQSVTPPLTIEYQPTEEGYLTHVRGTIGGGATTLLIDMPESLESFEADTLDDQRHHAYGYKPLSDAITSIPLTKLDSTQIRTDRGPMQWVATRNKYFLLALIAPDSAHGFASLRMRGGHQPTKGVATATATASLPITNGTFAFDLYAGPQSWGRLRTVGGELENVNPYAGFLHSVAQPFVTIVMRTLLWLKATLEINYGWVLVIFGVMLRLLMWPLNQSAMRSSLKMQRIQPELQAVQAKYKSDPEAQQKAIVKLYQEHGMSPLSPLLGCLPMLLPMPVLFALYFVFQNTIEFRGVSFLWMPDLALRDPYYITPVAMGASMFLLSWIGMRNAPPNPQAKVMMYMMPVMLTVMFVNFASGLNLYYGVQNLVAIPQQLLLSRERAKRA